MLLRDAICVYKADSQHDMQQIQVIRISKRQKTANV